MFCDLNIYLQKLASLITWFLKICDYGKMQTVGLITALNDVTCTNLVVFSVGLSVSSWAWRDRQTLPSLLLLEQVLKPERAKSNKTRLKYVLTETSRALLICIFESI